LKRKDYINWDDYFMGIALLSAKRSKDPNTQVGACIVDNKNKIIGIGYNGLPKGCSDDKFSWEREGSFEETKYAYVVHAEANAILNNIKNLEGARIYTTLFPCNECVKLIIQSGIKEIIYLNMFSKEDSNKASNKMLKSAGIKTRKHKTNLKEIKIDFL